MLTSSLTIIRAYFAVCTFRLGPQDLPPAAVFFVLSLILYGIATTALALPVRNPAAALLDGVLETALLLALTWGLLLLRGVPARFRQTAAALTGTGFLFTAVALPLLYLRTLYGTDPRVILVIGLLVVFLVAWNVAVMAHILRHALSASFPAGVLLAVGYIWLITTVMTLVNPGTAAA